MLTKPQVFYDNNLKQALGFQNPFYLKKAQQIRPMLYDGSVIAKETNVISIADSEETLMLEEESRSKMVFKQSDPMVLEKKVNIIPINYAELNRLSEDFGKSSFEIQKKQFLIENDRLLDQIISQDIVNIVVNSSMDMNTFVKVNSPVAMNDSVIYAEKFSELEQHCISLELVMQLNKEIFQKNNTSVNQTEPTFDHLFKLNNLKAELQAKDTTITKLKANIKCLNRTSTTNSVKETINIELEHRVAKLIVENERLKQTYKQLYDSIKPSRKGFCHNSIKNDLRKLKGNDIVDNAAQVSNATTIALGMYKLDPIVEQAKSLNPLDSASYSAYKYIKLIKELLGHVRDTCLDIHKPSKKLVAVTPINKKKTVRVSRATKSSRSKSTDNTKNDRILQISNSTQKKNKVEDHSRIVNSMFDARHELCFLEFVSDMNASSKSKSIKKAKKKEEWKPTGKVFAKIGYNWKPIGRTFTLVGNVCPLTRITATNKVPFREPILLEVVAQEYVVTKVYTRRPKIRNITILRVYYMEGLGHNLFSIGQFCDSYLEVAFRKHTCFVRNLEGIDLLSGSRETNLYTFSIGDMMASSPICLLSKASKTKSWLWHRRLSHLNFGAINHLAKNGLERGLPKLKFEKDHMCSACAIGKSKKLSHKPKSEDTNQEKLYLLHMDLGGPMRVASINGKKYILIIVDDYSRYYESVGISHETSVARTPQQNGVVERRNRTLVEAARTMFIYAKAPLFL
ncbi:retrovirus-related pol polyprotein from transposon TNT 1-94 [Tanacetum coccineum]